MKVVVTGGSGQLGSLVLERLVRRQDVERVVSLDLVPPRVPDAKIEFRIADLRDPGLERHLEGADVVVHLAFVVSGAPSLEAMRAVNVEGTRALFDAALRHQVARVVYASSVAAYGVVPGHPDPIVESTPRRRTSTLAYADHKYENEAMLDEFERAHPEMAIVRLRPGVLVGRRVAHVPPALIRRRVMPIVGDQRPPIVWDEDVADAVMLALAPRARGAFNLVAEEPIAGGELARLAGFRPVRVSPALAERLLRVSAFFGRTPADRGWVEATAVQLTVSAARARNELGWRPRFPTSADVATAFGKRSAARTDRRARAFLAVAPGVVRRAGERSAISGDARAAVPSVHLELTGRNGGDFALQVDEGGLSVSRGIPRPPAAVLTLGVGTLLALLTRTTSVRAGLAEGRIHLRGEPLAERVLAGLIEDFQRETDAPGAAGKVARRLEAWFQRR